MKKFDSLVFVLAVVGSVIALNVISLNHFGRADLTKDKQFTLGEATEDSLRRLHDPVTVTAYFTKDLPPPLSSHSRYVQDLLEEFHARGQGYFKYQFIDPLDEETDADKETKKDVKVDIFNREIREQTSVEKELLSLGIPPVEAGLRSENKTEKIRAYMGMVIRYGDKKEVIPVVQSTETLEYDITSRIRKLVREKTPQLAIIRGSGSAEPESMKNLQKLLSTEYDIKNIDLSTETSIPDEVDAAIVLGPKDPFSETAQHAIDRFVSTGRPMAFFLDAVKTKFTNLQVEPANHGLSDLLRTYGVEIEDGLIADTRAQRIPIRRGTSPFPDYVTYVFLPLASPPADNIDNDIARGLGNITFAFASPLKLNIPAAKDNETAALEGETILSTSEAAWVDTYPFEVDPFHEWTKAEAGTQAVRSLMVTVSGMLPAHFPDENDATGAAGRILVVGTSTILQDQLFGRSNAAIVLNMTDWMLQDQAMLAMRTRGLAPALIDPDISEGQKAGIRFGNILGLPLLFIVIGVVRMAMRNARRKNISI